MYTKNQRYWNTNRYFNKAVRVIKSRWYNNDISQTDINQAASYIRDQMADCSCQMCRNPRHCEWLPAAEQLTIQERRNIDKFNDWKQSDI